MAYNAKFKLILFIQPNITNHNFPHTVEQSVQHAASSVLRPSNEMRNPQPKKKKKKY